jgi:hypothetical protein
LVDRFDAATRAAARLAMKTLLAEAAGPRLRSPRRGLSLRRMLLAGLGICGGLTALALLGLGALSVRLSEAPIALDVLAPRIAQSLQERFDGRYSFTLGPTFLERGENGVAIGFEGVVIRNRQGRTVVEAPKGEVSLDPLALATLAVKVRRLDLVGLNLRLTVRPNGGLSVAGAAAPDAVGVDLPLSPSAPDADAAAASAPPAPLPARLGPLVWSLVEALTGQNQALDRLGVAHGRLEVVDAATGQTTVFSDFDLRFGRSGAVASLKVSALGPAGRWSAAMEAQGVGLRAFSLEVHDLNFDDLLLAMGRKLPFDASMPISAKVDLELAADKSLAAMRGRFELGAGYLTFDNPDQRPILVDEATGGWRWDDAGQRFLIENVQLFSGESHVFLDGSLSPPSPTNAAWFADLKSTDAVIAALRPGERPVKLDKSVFQARYLPVERKFIVDRFAIAGPGANGALSGEATMTDAGPTLKLKLDMNHTPLVDLPPLWPSFIVPDVRDWCIQNVRGGEAVTAGLTIDWDAAAVALALKKLPVPRDSVHGELTVRDASLQLLPGVPPLSGLDGGGVMNGHEVSMTGKRGYIEVSQGKRIQASDIAFSIPDTSPMPLNPAFASAHVQGAADALAELVARDALRPFVGLPVDPTTVKGQFDGHLGLDLKLGKTARPQDAVVHAAASLSNLQLDRFLGGERFEQGALTVSSEAGALKIAGQGKLFGVPASLEVDKGPRDEGLAQVSFTLDDAARARGGFGLGAALTGPMPVRVTAPLSKKGAQVEIDLTRVAIDNPAPGLVKPAGKPGKATFSAKADAEGAALSDIVLDAGGISIRGAARLASDGSFVSAKLSQVKLSPGDDFKADVAATDAGLKISARGAALDSRPIVKALLEQGSSVGGGKDFDLDLKVASVTGANKEALSQVEIGLSRRDGALTELKADARLGAAPISLRREESGLIRLQAGDAGGLVRFFNIYPHLEGGALEMVMRDLDGRQIGEAVVKDFTLRNEPGLRQLVAAGEPAGAGADASGALPINPDVVQFQRMTAKFARASGRIDLREAVIYNAQMGLTTQGYVDYAHDHIDLNGTFVPAYQVNNLVTRIPFVGLVLGGGLHEGLVGVNYRLVGPASAPELSVNPLSAMTPGFLRKIFGAIDGTGAQPLTAPGAAPPNAVSPPAAQPR